MGARPQPRIQSRSGRFTRSKDFPALLRQRLKPGAPQCVKARSIQPSLLMSLARAPTDGAVPASAVSVVQLVNVPLPLLRQRTLPGGGASVGNSNGAAGLASAKSLKRV